MRWVAFLRAINVAGHASVRMMDLAHAFVGAGCGNVSTVIQSGNVLFEAPGRGAGTLRRRLEERVGLLVGDEATVCLRSRADLERTARAAPFREEPGPDEKRYVAFLTGKPPRVPDLPLVSPREGLEVLAMAGLDAFVLSRRVKGRFGFPNNLVEKELGVPATTRNWTTVVRVLQRME